jgi:sugar/nucleoside kinase (ribokinase family)
MSLSLDPADTRPRRLLLMGNIPVDMVMRVPALPERGDDLLAESAAMRPGGGFTVLAAAAQAGLAGCYAGTHGDGVLGGLVRAALAEIECAVLQPPTRGRDTGFVLALVDAAGERTFVTAPDAVVPYPADLLAGLHPTPADLVYVSGYSLGLGEASAPLATWVGRVAEDRLVFCDLGPRTSSARSEILWPVLRRVDWLSCNMREAALLTRSGEASQILRELRRCAPGAGLLVRTGAAGCWLAMPGGLPKLFPAPTVGRVVDTNGAGDTHSGSFLAAIAGGKDPGKAVRMANLAAARRVARAAT